MSQLISNEAIELYDKFCSSPDATSIEEINFQPNAPIDEWRKVSIELAVELLKNTGRLEHVIITDLREILRRAMKEPAVDGIMIMSCAIIDCGSNRLEATKEIVIAHSYFFGLSLSHIFLSGTYKERVILSFSHFLGYVSMEGSSFEKDIRFTKSTFWMGGDFGYSTYKGNADFRSAIIRRNSHKWGITFRNSTLWRLLDFRHTEFQSGSTLDIEELDIRPGGNILLDITQIGKYQRNELRFLSLLRNKYRLKWVVYWYIKGCRFIQKKRSSVKLILGEREQDKELLHKAATQYNILRDNFRSLPSKEAEEDRCHYKYKDLLRKSGTGNKLSRFWNWLISKWFLGYGIYWQRPLYTAIGVILFFGGIYKLNAPEGFSCPKDVDFSPLYFSIITFTTIGYGDFAPLGIMRFVAGVEGLLGMVLMAFLVVSFARKIIR